MNILFLRLDTSTPCDPNRLCNRLHAVARVVEPTGLREARRMIADDHFDLMFVWLRCSDPVQRSILDALKGQFPCLPVALIDADRRLNPAPQRNRSNPEPRSDHDNLTGRQHDVLARIKRGLSNKEIARDLNLAEGTVKIHCLAIYRKLGVTNRTQAAVVAGTSPSPKPAAEKGYEYTQLAIA